jgi:hypothetical protein
MGNSSQMLKEMSFTVKLYINSLMTLIKADCPMLTNA